MTEEEWLVCDEPEAMLEFLRSKASNRKLRLFACGCWRQRWDLIPDQRNRKAIETSELYADEEVSKGRLHEAWQRAVDETRVVTLFNSYEAALATCIHTGAKGDDEESNFQCILLRHIIGNHFRPYPAPDHWPSTVVQLAHALYNGQDCTFALHDALLEAGHAELAEHFKERWHPKGCWVVDLILGKQ
jgi:hypothetical protein